MKEKAWYPILYMFILTGVSAAVLIGISRATQERVTANREVRFEKAVLRALASELDLPPDASTVALHRLFVEKIQAREVRTDGGVITYYVLVEDGRLHAYAVPFRGQGFWAEIAGVIGLAPDLRTVRGIAFHEQSETPGLGARITEAEWRRTFVGKELDYETLQKLTGEKAAPLLIGFVSSGMETDESQVHAITGATQTSMRLERIINKDLFEWLRAIATEHESR